VFYAGGHFTGNQLSFLTEKNQAVRGCELPVRKLSFFSEATFRKQEIALFSEIPLVIMAQP
jgi:hypothetical protein